MHDAAHARRQRHVVERVAQVDLQALDRAHALGQRLEPEVEHHAWALRAGDELGAVRRRAVRGGHDVRERLHRVRVGVRVQDVARERAQVAEHAAVLVDQLVPLEVRDGIDLDAEHERVAHGDRRVVRHHGHRHRTRARRQRDPRETRECQAQARSMDSRHDVVLPVALVRGSPWRERAARFASPPATPFRHLSSVIVRENLTEPATRRA